MRASLYPFILFLFTLIGCGNIESPTDENVQQLSQLISVLLDENQPDELQRSMLRSVNIELAGEVTIDPAGVSLHHKESDTPVDLIVSSSLNAEGNTVVVVTFTGENTEAAGGSLKDGNYVLQFSANAVLGVDGKPALPSDIVLGDRAEDRMFRLFGDTDGDRDVDGQDYGRYGLTIAGEYNFALDSDADGDIDGQDFARFRRRFMSSLPF